MTIPFPSARWDADDSAARLASAAAREQEQRARERLDQQLAERRADQEYTARMLAASTAASAQQAQAIRAELLAQVDSALVEAEQQARTAVQEAQRVAAAAQRDLQAHEQTPAAPGWAATRRQLADTAEDSREIAAALVREHEQKRSAVQAALADAYHDRLIALRQQLAERESEARVDLDQRRKALEDAGAAHQRDIITLSQQLEHLIRSAQASGIRL